MRIRAYLAQRWTARAVLFLQSMLRQQHAPARLAMLNRSAGYLIRQRQSLPFLQRARRMPMSISIERSTHRLHDTLRSYPKESR